jgi:CSLREA domain-containing protein
LPQLRRRASLLTLGVLSLCILTAPLHAAVLTYTVTVTTDTTNGTALNCTNQSLGGATPDASCSLRDALAASSANATSSTPSVISFAATSASSITLTHGALVLPSYTTVQGATTGSAGTLANLITINANNLNSVFTVASGVSSAALNNLILTGGNGQSNPSHQGGAIANSGTLSISSCTIKSSAAQDGSGLFNASTATLTITGSTITANTATGNGGGIYNQGTLSLLDSTVAVNSASEGGGLYHGAGTVLLRNTTLTTNTATSDTGGIYINALFTAVNSIIEGNSASVFPDELDNTATSTFVATAENINFTTSITSPVSALANNGGPTQTMMLSPAATCGGSTSNLGGLTLDQRGYARTTAYSSGTCVDQGAVQTHYGLSFAQQPSSVPYNTAITPAPIVQFTESGTSLASAAGTVTIALTNNPSLQAGTPTAALNSSGLATFSNIQVTANDSAETLTASLPINANSVKAVSNSFSTTTPVLPVSQLVFGSAPAANVSLGSSGGSGITVLEESSANSTVTTAADPVILTVTGPSGYSKVYAAQPGGNAVSGVATFDTSANTLTVAGTYTYTATYSTFSIATTQTVLANSFSASGTTTVGVTNPTPITVTFTFTGTVTLNASAAIYAQVYTQGVKNLDFTLTSGGTCAANTQYTAGHSCTVNVAFKPRAAGMRLGAVRLYDTSGSIAATAFVDGVGSGAIGVFQTGTTQTQFASGLNNTHGVTFDVSGNLYVADYSNKRVLEYPAGSSTPTVIANSSMITAPEVIALDGNGNIWIADNSRGLILIPPGSSCGTTGTCSVTSLSGYPATTVAIGPGNTIYAANNTYANIFIYPPGGGTPSQRACGMRNGGAPSDMAIGPDGTIYIASAFTNGGYGNSDVGSLAPGATTATLISSNFSNPHTIRRDPAGNLYVVDWGGASSFAGRLQEIPYGTTTPQLIPVTGSQTPFGIDFDANGNLFAGVYTPPVGSTNDGIIELNRTAATVSIATPTTVGNTTTSGTVTLANIGNAALSDTFTAGTNITADPSVACTGTLAAAATCALDGLFSPTVVGTPVTGTLSLSTNGTGAPLTLTISGNSQPAVAALAFGTAPAANIVAGSNGGSAITVRELDSSNALITTAADALTLTVTYPDTTTETYNATAVNGVATFDTSANSLTLTGAYTYTATKGVLTATASQTVYSKSFTTGTTTVGTPSASPITATLVFTSAATLNASSTLYAQAYTQGILHLDFSVTSGGTCAAGTAYTAGQSCTVNVGFTPTAAGLRLGAVRLYDGSSNIVATAYLSGTGIGAIGVFQNRTTQTTFATGLDYPRGMNFDAAGNLFVADDQNSRVLEYPAGSSTPTVIADSSTLSAPFTVVIDGNGTLWIADAHRGVVEVPQGSTCGTLGTCPVISIAPNADSVAIDPSNNVYASFNNDVNFYIIPAGGGTVTTRACGLSSHGAVGDMTIGPDGTIYFVETYSTTYAFGTRAASLAPGATTPTILTSSLTAPISIRRDPAGDLYIVDLGDAAASGRLVELPYGSTTLQSINVSGSQYPTASALDPAGNLYVLVRSLTSTSTSDNLVKITRTAASSTVSGSTKVGSTTTSRTVTLANIGNAALSDTFVAGTNINVDPAVACTGTLATAATCLLDGLFAPTVNGSPVTGTLTLADNGTGTPLVYTISGTAVPAQLLFGTGTPAATLVAGNNAGTITVKEADGSGNTITNATDTVTLTVTGSGGYSRTYTAQPSGAAVAGVATFDTSADTLTVAGTYTYTAKVGTTLTVATTQTVTAAALNKFAVTVPATAVAGTPTTVSVTAQDTYGNTVTTYSGTVHFTSNDPNAVLPANSTLASGTSSFSATFLTATAGATATITAADTVSTTITGSSAGTTVSPGAVTQFAISYANPTYAGLQNTAVITPEDAYNNINSTYTGSITITSNDSAAVISPNTYTFFTSVNSDTVLAPITLNTVTNTATITVTPSIGAASTLSSIVVKSGSIYTVTTLTDDATGVGANCHAGSSSGSSCSLRDAIAAATSFASSNPGVQPVVTFKSGLTGTLTLANGGFTLTQPVIINGPGANNLTISANSGSSSIFAVNSGVAATISSMELTGVNSPSGSGGAISSSGALTLNAIYITSNTGKFGGGVYSGSGTLTILNSTIANNISSASGGGIYAVSGTITNTTIANNTSGGYGGGIDDIGTLTLVNDTITGNSALNNGAGAYIDTATVSNTVIRGNSSPGYPDAWFYSAYNNLGGNSINQDPSATSSVAALLTSLGSYGGTMPTILPIPGSSLIGAGSTSASGILSTDERGNPRIVNGKIDIGATQTNYSLAFVQQPASSFIQYATITPALTVQLKDNSVALPLAGQSIALALTTDAASLSGTASASTSSTGLSTFSGLSITSPESTDTFTAGIGGVTATSSSFTVTSAVSQLVFTTPPTTSIAAGSSAGTVKVSEENASVVSTGATDTILLTVLYPDTTTKSYTATAVAGVADFTSQLAAVTLTTPGSYTYVASTQISGAPALSSSPATQTVTAAALASLTVTGFPSTSTIGDTGHTIVVTARDQYGNLATNFTGTVTISTGDSAAVLTPSSYTYTSADAGVHTFGVVFNTATATGTWSITATSASPAVSGSEYAISVSQATPVITWSPSTTIAYGTTLSSILNATAAYNSVSDTGAATYTATPTSPAGAPVTPLTSTTVLPAGTYTLGVTFAATNNYVTVSKSIPGFTVTNAATASITGTPITQVYGVASSSSITVTGVTNGVTPTSSTNTISYFIDGNSPATAPYANGIATITIPATLGGGAHTLHLSYGGDSNYASASGTVGWTTTTAASAIAGTPITQTYGSATTSSITVTGVTGGIVPAGATISYSIDSGSTLTASYNSTTGTATVTLPATLLGGAHTLHLTYAGDTNYAGSTGTVLWTTATATPTIAGSTITQAYGIASSATITISGIAGGATPTGSSISYIIDSGNTQTAPYAAGTATIAIPSTLAVGLHTLHITYTGDTNYSAAMGADSWAVSQGTVTATIAGTAVTQTYGTAATSSITVTGAVGAPTPTAGTNGISYYFDSNNGTLYTAALNSTGSVATATATIPAALGGGAHVMHLIYGGDNTYNSAVNTVAWTTTTAVSTISGSSITQTYGVSATTTITVAGVAGGATPTAASNTISYTLDGGSSQTAPYANGTATIVVPPSLTAASHTLNLSYAGDANYRSATGTVTWTAAKAALTVTTNAASMIFGQTVPAVSGSITGVVTGDGITATYSTTGTSTSIAGTYPITALLSDPSSKLGNYTVTNAGNTLTISKATSSLAFAQTVPTGSGAGSNVNVTFTATLANTTAGSTGTPTGTVLFQDGTTTIGTAPIVAGVATFTTSFTTTGLHLLTVSYAGDTGFSPSSAILGEVIQTPGYTATSNPTVLNIVRGNQGTAVITLAPVGGYQGVATFACSGLPAFAACAFSPTPITFTGNNTPQTTTVTVYTLASHEKTTAASGFMALPALLLAACMFFVRRNRKLRAILFALLLATGVLSMQGCGGTAYVTPVGTTQSTVIVTSTSPSGVNYQASVLIINITQ